MSWPVIDSMSLPMMVALFLICTTQNGEDGKKQPPNKHLQAKSPNAPHRWPKKMKIKDKLKSYFKSILKEIEYYKLLFRHPGTPRISKFFLGAGIAYAISPIDLIPDFMPVIGHLDDIIIVPLLIGLAVIFIPESVICECRTANQIKGQQDNQPGPRCSGR